MSEAFAFGSFRLMPAERVLLDGGRPLRLGSRALDILVTLLEKAGETVGKDELLARVWPDTSVDEASLRVHIAALRKALGDGQAGNRFITNVPGRGYVFVARAVREHSGQADEPPRTALPGNDIPAALTRIVGRDETIASLAAQLTQRRLLTIVGPGGIGKTTVAAAIARSMRGAFPDGVWFVGLASVPTGDLVPSALGAALGIPLPGDNPIAGLTAWLREKHALIILDNCEHVIGAAAGLVEELAKSAARIHILATSREPLRAMGEWRHRLATLKVPSNANRLAADAALQYSAVQLFSERAAAATDETAIQASDLPAVIEICRRLDGVPLALELAAAHVGVFGIKGLATRLDSRLALLIQGRRTALPRHQTLRATLDWSYDLLPESERAILRRLAVFQGDFTIDAAVVVTADDRLHSGAVVNGIANLVDKSLITADVSGDTTYYHLLEMTRSYAWERLQESGEHDEIMKLHATYFREWFAGTEVGAWERSKDAWVAQYGRDIGNLRAALLWAFSPIGDPALSVALAAVATNFWVAMSLLSECCEWGLKAVAQLGAAAGTRDEMLLQCGLGQALTYSRGMQLDARAALLRALALAEAQGNLFYQFRATYALWLFALRVVDFRECLVRARECELLAETMDDSGAKAIAAFAFGQARYYLAEHTTAAADLQHARAIYPSDTRGGDPIRLGADFLTCSSCYQAVTFWSLGLVDQAYRAGRDAIREARGVNHPVSLCIALAAPSSILLVKMGYWEEAERCIDELIDHSESHSLTPYHAFGLCSKGGLMAARGDLAAAEQLLRFGLQRAREVAYYLFDAFFQAELAAVLGATDRVDEGLAEVDAALRHAEKSESLWCMPEVLRIKGELVARRDGANGDAAEGLFRVSMALAARQRALSWQLRGAMSLARLRHDQGQATEAFTLLDSVYRAFTEGFQSADLQQAKRLLAELA